MSMAREHDAIAISTGREGSLRECLVLEGHRFTCAVSTLRDWRHKADLTQH
jgi:hypothetical protein